MIPDLQKYVGRSYASHVSEENSVFFDNSLMCDIFFINVICGSYLTATHLRPDDFFCFGFHVARQIDSFDH